MFTLTTDAPVANFFPSFLEASLSFIPQDESHSQQKDLKNNTNNGILQGVRLTKHVKAFHDSDTFAFIPYNLFNHDFLLLLQNANDSCNLLQRKYQRTNIKHINDVLIISKAFGSWPKSNIYFKRKIIQRISQRGDMRTKLPAIATNMRLISELL